MFKNQVYLLIPGHGEKVFELPPLLVRSGMEMDAGKLFKLCQGLTERELTEEGIADIESKVDDLAVQRFQKYKELIQVWLFGDSVWRWVEQCRITFQNTPALSSVLRFNVWPYPDASKLVRLLMDKKTKCVYSSLPAAVGTRLQFPTRPQISACSFDYLFYGYKASGEAIFAAWEAKAPSGKQLLPPERFCFQTIICAP